MADSGDRPTGGLFDSLRRLLDASLGLVQRRIEIFALELQEEKVRALDLLVRVAAVVVLGLLTLVAGTATMVVALWQTSPVLVLGLVTLAYGLAAAGLGWGLRKRLRHGPKPFAGTIEEFRRDRECFGKRN
jgi:uncharacterized membrane protein YqjE